MTNPRILAVLTLANLALLTLTLSTLRTAAADAPPAVLRGRALEIVDDQGRVRASLNVLPATVSASGDRSNETVLLRLITERGRPSVKIAASEESAGLSFAGPTGTRDTYVILEAKGKSSSLKLRNENGREQVVAPEAGDLLRGSSRLDHDSHPCQADGKRRSDDAPRPGPICANRSPTSLELTTSASSAEAPRPRLRRRMQEGPPPRRSGS